MGGFKFYEGDGFTGTSFHEFSGGESIGLGNIITLTISLATSWKEQASFHQATSWKEQQAFTQPTAWKEQASFHQATSWKQQASFNQATSWLEKFYKTLPTSWKEQASFNQSTSWKQQQAFTQSTAWKEQASFHQATSWFESKFTISLATSWKEQASFHHQTSWKEQPSFHQATSWRSKGNLDMAFGLNAYVFPRYRVPNNVNYQWYRLILIQNYDSSLLPTGSTVDLTFNMAAMVAAGEVDEFGDQFRMTYMDGQNAEQELDIQILNPNTSSSILRFPIKATILPGNQSFSYRLYSKVIDMAQFEETFRDLKNVYYFEANQLSSNLAQTNGTWSNSKTGIQRTDDTTTAKLGFNVPGNASVEVDFRFLDSGSSSQTSYIGIEWRGDGSSSRTFRLDNDNTSGNRVVHYFDGSSWNALGTPITNVQLSEVTMGVTVLGSTVQLYANGTLLATVTDATAPTGGMQIVLPAGSEVNISELRVKYGLGNYTTMFTTGTVTNSVPIGASHRLLLKGGTFQKMPALVVRLKKQPNGSYICENIQNVGEAGDSIPATTGQQDSLEIKLWNVGNNTYANVAKVNT